jgi:NTE family protein
MPKKPISLCLSGGGYRAASYHLGALQRLNELGILAEVKRISSVSGGSILAAHLAQIMVDLRLKSLSFSNWEKQVASPFREQILLKDIRTVPFLKQWILPWNWFRSGPAVDALEKQYHRHLTRLSLSDLPNDVRFTFCSTNLLFGVNWIFEKEKMGDYLSGHITSKKILNTIPVAKAVAASSCFPPLFLPMKMVIHRNKKASPQLPKVVHLSDGGIYDNLGVQPVWTNNPILILSDGGAPFIYDSGTNPVRRLKRYLAISTNQGLSLRWRWINTRYKQDGGDLEGTFWRIGNNCNRYSGMMLSGYSEDFCQDYISKIRTDMNAFSLQEINILENHGYLMADAALRTHMSARFTKENSEGQTPHIELMNEPEAAFFLHKSGKRQPLKSLIQFILHPCEPFCSRLPLVEEDSSNS